MKVTSRNPDALSHEALSSDAEQDIARNLRRRWFYLIPAVFITYSLAYLDRANYGFGAAAGLAATLHITGAQTSLLGALFFLGYFTFQIPGARIAGRGSARWLIFFALVTWGSLAALTGVIREFWLLALDRFLLGVAESVIFPTMLVLLTRWFTREERSRANSVFILGNPITVLWMSAITGYLIQAYGWQMTFILEGIPTVLWAPVWIATVRDRPSEARWLSASAAEALEEVLTREQAAMEPVKSMRKALIRGDVILLSIQYFCWSLGLYGFVLWLPTIIRSGGSMTMGQTGLLAAIPYVVAIILMMAVSYISDKTLRREPLVWPFLLASGLGMLGSFLFADNSFIAAFVCLVISGGCMYAPYGPFWAIVPERLPRNVTAEVLAVINSFGALGGFAGSYLVGLLQAVTGSSRAGFLLMSSSLIFSSLLILLLPKPKPAHSGANEPVIA
ncbi:MAG: MFS transporter [Acidobacteria bacterium]|nr:MFS transporter [Acidobacteriota bacterium]